MQRKRNRTVVEFIKNNLLYRRCIFSSGREVLQLMVPKELRNKVLKLGHDSVTAGHQGIKDTLQKITEEFFWLGVQSDVKRYVKACDVCQKTMAKGKNEEKTGVCLVIADDKDIALTIEPTKCEIGYKTREFVGHKLGTGRVEPKEDTRDKMQTVGRPQAEKQGRGRIFRPTRANRSWAERDAVFNRGARAYKAKPTYNRYNEREPYFPHRVH